jgi:Holliday junction resolvase
MKRNLSPHHDALYRIKRGLAGYVSYLAACEMNEAFSEYVLYEPTLRILTAQGFTVQCEYPCPGFQKTGPGDFKKIDFVAEGNGEQFALEMKWARARSINVGSDIEKIGKYSESFPQANAYLCIFGRKSHISEISLKSADLKERGKGVYAEFGVTKYGCRIYELQNG